MRTVIDLSVHQRHLRPHQLLVLRRELLHHALGLELALPEVEEAGHEQAYQGN